MNKKWIKAGKQHDEATEWLGSSDGHEKLAEILLRATMTYDDDDPDDKSILDAIGIALSVVHPVAVFGACSELVQEGTRIVWRHFIDEDDDDDKVTTCKAVKEATKAVCDLVTATNYWNAKEVSTCLNQTADLLDQKRITDEAFGESEDEGVSFIYSFEKGEVTLRGEEKEQDESKDS